MTAINLFKEGITTKLKEKEELDSMIASLNEQLKQIKALHLNLDLGNTAVHQEYKRMN